MRVRSLPSYLCALVAPEVFRLMPYFRIGTSSSRMLALVSTILLSLVLLAVLAAQSSAQAIDPNVGVTVPGVTLGDIDVLSPSTVTVTGSIYPANVAGTSAFVEYRGLDGLIKRAPITLGAGFDGQNVSTTITDLLPGSAYEARIVATNPLNPLLGAASGQSSVTDFRAFRTDNGVVDTRTGALVPGAAAGGSSRVKCTKIGTAKSERLRGTSKRDVICGLGGNDRITGLSGNDTLVGGKGRDRIYGDAGRDRISARDRMRDYVNGGSGVDRATVDSRKGRDGVRSIERGVRKARGSRR